MRTKLGNTIGMASQCIAVLVPLYLSRYINYFKIGNAGIIIFQVFATLINSDYVASATRKENAD